MALEDVVALFTFTWDGVASRDAFIDSSLRIPHQYFNQLFQAFFPKIFYTVPFTNYTDQGFGITSRLTGTGETILNEQGLRSQIMDMAYNAGIVGNPANLRISVQSYAAIQGGAGLDQDVIDQGHSNVNPLVTQEGADKFIDDLIKMAKPWIIAGVLLTVWIVSQRKK